MKKVHYGHVDARCGQMGNNVIVSQNKEEVTCNKCKWKLGIQTDSV